MQDLANKNTEKKIKIEFHNKPTKVDQSQTWHRHVCTLNYSLGWDSIFYDDCTRIIERKSCSQSSGRYNCFTVWLLSPPITVFQLVRSKLVFWTTLVIYHLRMWQRDWYTNSECRVQTVLISTFFVSLLPWISTKSRLTFWWMNEKFSWIRKRSPLIRYVPISVNPSQFTGGRIF